MTLGPGPEALQGSSHGGWLNHPASLSIFIFTLPCVSQTPPRSIFFKCLLLESLTQESWSSEQRNFTYNDHEIVTHDHLLLFLRVAPGEELQATFIHSCNA